MIIAVCLRRVLRKIFKQEAEENYIIKIIMIRTYLQIFFWVRRMIHAGHMARMVKNRNAYRILVGKPEGMRPLGRPLA
jgi:hypothetical protein